jgi:hypothetical protein
MKNLNLHFAKVKLDRDIECYQFSKMYELLGYILSNCEPNRVYLISINDKDHRVFVSEFIADVLNFADLLVKPLVGDVDIYFQEYYTYQSAYQSALEMAEISELCWNN